MESKIKYFLRSLAITAFLFLGIFVFSVNRASALTYTSTATGGVWATGSTWVGGVAPGTTDTVIIATTGANTVSLGAAATCAGLTINSGSILTVGAFAITVNGPTSITGTINLTSLTGTKTFNGDVTLNSGAVWSETAAIVFTSSGSWTNNATTFTASTGVHTFSGATKTFSGSTATVIPSVSISGSYTNSGTLTVATLLTIAGSLANNSTVTATASLAGVGSFTNAATGTLNIGNGITITTLTASAVGNTVKYTRAGTQTGKVTTYHNLTIAGTSAKTFATTPTVNGTLSMEGTATIVATSGVVTYGASATLQYNRGATAQAVTSEEWISPWAATGGVIIKGSAAQTLNAAKVFNAGTTLTIDPGAILAASSFLLTFNGDFINNGTFTSGSGGVTITGTAATQAIGGFTNTGTVTFSKTSGTATLNGNVNGGAFTVSGNGGTLNMGTGRTHTFTGIFTSTAGSIILNNSTLNIDGSISGSGATWDTGTGTVDYGLGSAQNVFGITYYNLTLSNIGNRVFAAGIAINNILSIEGTAWASGAVPSYGANATLQYKGSASQTTGTEFADPFNGSGGVIINNASGVILGASETITNTLYLTAGSLSIGANTLTLNGPVSVSSGSLVGSIDSNLVFGGSGAAGSLPAITLNDLTINRANGVSMTGAVTVGGILTLTSGIFTVGANTLTLSGAAISGTTTNLSTDTTSNIFIDGSTPGLILPSSVTALHDLTINNTNGLTLGAGVTLSGVLTETSGKLNITVTATTDNRVYNGGTSSAGTPTLTAGNFIVGHTVTLTQAFANKNVGTSKTITASVSGADATKYNVTSANNNTGVITTYAITVTAATDTKEYDGDTTSVSTPTITVGTLQGSDTSGFTQAYSTKTVGTGKTITPTGVVSDGNSGNNYAVTLVNNTTGVITAKALTVTGMTASNKEYDGGTSVTLSGGTLVGKVGADVVNIDTRTGAFDTKAIGTGKSITVSSVTLTGADASNYTVTNPSGITANITAKALTVTGMLATTKEYDGDTTVTLTGGSLVGVVGGDTVTINTRTGSFDTKTVGTAKPVTVSSVTLTGGDAGNYTVANPADVTGDITAKALTVTGMAATTKEYDGGTTVTLTGGTLVGKVGVDVVSINTRTGSFSDKNIGTGKPVTVSSVTLTGADSGNYTVTNPIDVTGNITAKNLTVSGLSASNREYDGTTLVTLTGGSLVGVIALEDVSIGTRSGSFATKSVGTGKSVTVSSITLTGADSGNYTVSNPVGITADITAKTLTVSGLTASDKQYDGDTSVTLSGGTLDGVILNDTVSISTRSGSFADSDIGTAKPVTVSSVTLTGADSANYTVTNPSGITASITAKTLTVTGMTASNKEYDGNTDATLSGGTLSGKVTGDTVSIATRTGSFDTKTVGTGKSVTVLSITLTGAQASNYTVTNPTGITADITAKALTVSGLTATSREYDGTTNVTLNDGSLVGVINPDDVSISTRSGSFATKTVGTGKSVTVSSITLAGTDSGNYTVSNPVGITADITAKALTVSGMTANDKDYDGTTHATLNFAGATLVGKVGGDSVTLNTSSAVGNFDTADVGENKSVNVSGLTLSGSDAQNYSLAQPTTTANIRSSIAQFSLSHPGTMSAGDRVSYTVTQQDYQGQSVAFGSSTIYLYSSSVSPTKKFYNAPSGGSVITSIRIESGASTAEFWYYDELAGNPTITASDHSGSPDGVVGLIDATDSLSITSGAVTKFLLNNITNIVAGDRAAYTVTRKDQFNNLVNTGTNSVYLYSGSTSPNKKFYDQALGGNEIMMINIIDGQSAVDFWYYDELAGNFTITASDNVTAPDGSVGIIDFADSLEVTSGVNYTFILSDPGDMSAGERKGYTITRQDQYGNPSIGNDLAVYLYSSSVGANKKFYSAANGGTIISSLVINTGDATANFWYYDQTPGDYTITVSDDMNTPDGSVGIIDGTDQVLVNGGPLATFTINNVTNLVAGERAAYTVTRKDQFGNQITNGSSPVYLYSTAGGNNRFYNAAIDGDQVTSLTITEGNSTAKVWYYNELVGSATVTFSDNAGSPDGANGVADATDALSVGPAEVAQFILNNPGDMTAITRLGYTVTRKDRFNNLVNTGSNTVYLYTDSSGPSSFYDVALNGNNITSIDIINGVSTANFWYYEEAPGSWNVTVSDSMVAPDGSTGIIDAVDQVVVSAAPVVATKLVILPPENGTVDAPVTVVVQAQDNAGNIDTSFQSDVTLLADGSATGGGLVDIVNGVGTIQIYDTLAETVNLHLSDTQITNLNVDSTHSLIFYQGAIAKLTISDVSDISAGNRLFYTVTRQDQYNNLITDGSTTVYLYTNATGELGKFYNASTAGNIITSVNILPGNSTANFWYYEEIAGTWLVTVSDNASAPDGNNGLSDSSDAVIINPAATASFILNNPGDMAVNTRLGYSVSREDLFGNPVISGFNTVYLYSNSTGAKLFYDAASNGAVISSVTIGNGTDTADLWHYDSVPGTWIITASENPSTPNGSVGIVDDTDAVIVIGTPIVATKIVILPTETSAVGEPVTITLNAQDNSGNIDTTFQGDVTLVASGSATGGGVIHIVNGVGRILINDPVNETIQLYLVDSAATNLDVSSIQFVTFAILGSSSGVLEEELPDTSLKITGVAYPGAEVFLAQKNAKSVAFTKLDVDVSATGSFSYSGTGFEPGIYTYSLMVKDKDGRQTQTKVFNADFIKNKKIVKEVIVAPTIDLLRFMVTKGDFVKVIGYAAPSNRMRIELDGGINYETKTDDTGAYQILINTAGLTPAGHTLRARQLNSSTKKYGDYSTLVNFMVTALSVPQADLNGDGKTSLSDWSIFLEWYRKKDIRADLNKDKKVNTSDLSVFLRGMKKK